MSLIDEMMEDCVIIDKTTVSDAEGGHTKVWVEGASIKVAITCDTSIQTRIAQQEGFTNTYTLTTKKENALEFHDVIKRVSDGKIFRVTSDGTEKRSPKVSSLNMAQVTAENWELTNDEE